MGEKGRRRIGRKGERKEKKDRRVGGEGTISRDEPRILSVGICVCGRRPGSLDGRLERWDGREWKNGVERRGK